MVIRFPEIHKAILNAEVGQSLTYEGLHGRTIRQILGDITYAFTGHVESTDARIGQEGCEHVTLDWNWRVVFEYSHSPDKNGTWTLVIHKIDAPDDQRYSGKEKALIEHVQSAQATLEAAQAKLDNMRTKRADVMKG